MCWRGGDSLAKNAGMAASANVISYHIGNMDRSDTYDDRQDKL
jgi:hypothetical protein